MIQITNIKNGIGHITSFKKNEPPTGKWTKDMNRCFIKESYK